MELEELFSYRRSKRMYEKQQITESQLQQILEAAQNAPLAVGNRPKARLTVVQNEEIESGKRTGDSFRFHMWNTCKATLC